MVTTQYRRSKTVIPLMVANERTSPERARKGQVVRITDDIQRIIGGLTILSKCGDIDQAQTDAAERWYKDYVMGIVGVRDPEAKSSGRAPDIHVAMLARTEAIGRCRLVRESLGMCAELRLRLLLIDELSFSAIAAKLLAGDVNGRKKIAAQMIFLLQQLAELYERFDRARLSRTRVYSYKV